MNKLPRHFFASASARGFFLILLLALSLSLFSGCSLTNLASSIMPTTSVEPENNPTAEAPATKVLPAQDTPQPLTGEDARQTVKDFLTAIQLDANSSLAAQLLSPFYQQEVAQNQLQSAVLKTTETIPSFEVSAAQLSNDGNQADVEVTLYLAKPVNLNFSLINHDTGWKIDKVKTLISASDYPSTPEGVVQAFLIAYQESPDDMSDYVTGTRRSHLPPGGSVGMLQILGPLEGVLIKSAVVNPDPPFAAILAIVKAGGIESQRQFLLDKENERWGINQIDVIQ